MNMDSKKIRVTTLAMLAMVASTSAFAGSQTGGPDGCAGQSEVIIGQDNDNVDNPLVQTTPPPSNRSLNNADILQGGGGCDILIGLFGNDVLLGGEGSDILIGGTEQFDPDGFGNKDVMIGGGGNDVNIWAPGDGSDAFIGGLGLADTQVFGVLDRDDNNVPVLTDFPGTFGETGIPTAEVTGSPGFCELEFIGDSDLGFDYLVSFFVRASGNLAVTVRLKDVEQLFCTSAAGGAITYANLRDEFPSFVEVTPEEVQAINPLVSKIIR